MKIDYRKPVPIVFFIILIVLSFFIIRKFIPYIFLGVLLAYMFYPVYRFIYGKIKNKTFSALFICTIVLLLLIVPALFFTKVLVEQSYSIYLVLKERISAGLFSSCQHQYCQTIKTISENPGIQFQLQEALKSITNWVIQKGSDVLFSLPSIFLSLFVLFFTLFYALIDGEYLAINLYRYLHIDKSNYDHLLNRSKEIIHGVIFGYFLVALIQGAMGAIGFLIFGIHSAIFWGLVMAFLSIIPFLGTGLVWVPAGLMLVFQGLSQDSNILLFKGIGLLVYSFIFVASIDNLIRPKLMSGKAKVHPAILLLGVLGGIYMFGPFGVIIAPMVLALTTVIIETYFVSKV